MVLLGRQKHLRQFADGGAKLHPSPPSSVGKRLGRALRWPFVFASGLAFTLGAVAVGGAGRWGATGLGLLAVVSLHLTANLLNDVADSDSGVDRLDPTYYGFFGGSKLIVEGILSRRVYLRLAIGLATVAGLAIGGLAWLHASWLPLPVAGGVGLLAAAYSLPPAKLAYRGLGELTVGLLFGPLAVAAGYYTRTGHLSIAESLPPGIIAGLLTVGILLANEIPDANEDRVAGKRTLIVRVGAVNGWRLYALVVGPAFALLGIELWRGAIGGPGIAGFAMLPFAARATAIMRRQAGDKSAMSSASRIAIAVQGGVILAMILA